MTDKKDKKNPEKAKNEVDLKPKLDDTVLEWVMDDDLSDLEEMQSIIDELTEALSAADRQKKRQVMRRFKSKISVARKRQEKRHANKDVIKRRARMQVIKNLKTKFAGGNYANYKDASASQKSAIERMVARRKALITRATNRMINKKRQQDRKKFQTSSESFENKSLIENFNIIYNSIIKE